MKLKDLFENCSSEEEVKDIKINSKKIEKGDIFVCVSGVNFNRHDFIDEAVENGAVAVVVSKDIKRDDVEVIKVDDTDEEMPKIARKLYQFNPDELKIIAVTGTDGKTSIATIVSQLIGTDKCGYIGTNGYGCSKFHHETANTTPDSDLLYKYFKEFKDAGCTYVVMEVSSEAMYRKRVRGLYFDLAILSNVTREHLNTHKTLENYINCKKEVFRHLKENAYAIFNTEDEHYEEFTKVPSKYLSYGKKGDMRLIDYEEFEDKTLIEFEYLNRTYNIKSPLLAKFNVYNLLAAFLGLLTLGFDLEELIRNLDNLEVDGRIDFIDLGQKFSAVVDYAHTPNGIEEFLKFVKKLNKNKIIVVMGQAGERDKEKRKDVGKILDKYVDLAVLCYEDPRFEDPLDTVNMIKDGFSDKEKAKIIVDRKEAIQYAVDIADVNDIVLVLGKGNENYHSIKGKSIFFNDEIELKDAIDKRLEKDRK